MTSLGHNLISDWLDSDYTSSVTDLQGDPGLVIETVPGQTYYELLPDSQAIDAGDNVTCEVVDQLGTTRPLDGNLDGSAVCDIGAYEY